MYILLATSVAKRSNPAAFHFHCFSNALLKVVVENMFYTVIDSVNVLLYLNVSMTTLFTQLEIILILRMFSRFWIQFHFFHFHFITSMFFF